MTNSSLGSVEAEDHVSKVSGYRNLAGLGGSTGKLAEALAKAQSEFKAVNKSKTAKGEKFSYKYADLADVLSMVIPILSKHGIAFMQPLRRDGEKIHVITRIQLADEVMEDCGLPIPTQVSPQELGKYLTYYRRYGASSFLGISTDDDTDGPAPETAKPFTSEQPKPKAVTKPVAPAPPPKPAPVAPSTFSGTDEDVPSNIGDKPSPDERKIMIARLRGHIDSSSSDEVKAFVRKITGQEGTTGLTSRQWKEVLDPLDVAAKEGKLKEVLQ